jgi:hypothetical protein
MKHRKKEGDRRETRDRQLYRQQEQEAAVLPKVESFESRKRQKKKNHTQRARSISRKMALLVAIPRRFLASIVIPKSVGRNAYLRAARLFVIASFDPLLPFPSLKMFTHATSSSYIDPS